MSPRMVQRQAVRCLKVHSAAAICVCYCCDGLCRYRQKIDFSSFPGPVVATTNCVLDPPKSYKNRLFTTNEVCMCVCC